MTTKPHKKEAFYLVLRAFFSLLALYGIGQLLSALSSPSASTLAPTLMGLAFYFVFFVVYFRLLSLLMLGHLRGNGVEISDRQFPQVFLMMQEIAATYEMKVMPKVFLIQSGGVLNAYATRFVGKDYVAIYSEVFSLVESEPDVLKFILAHEFAHVKNKHMQKRFWTFLSIYVPFLGPAYSRACEYTCDSFAHEVAPVGSAKGLLLLAAGKDLYNKVNLDHYLADFKTNDTAAVKFAEVFASHPHLPKRIEYLKA